MKPIIVIAIALLLIFAVFIPMEHSSLAQKLASINQPSPLNSPVADTVLDVCMYSEPDSLYIYAEIQSIGQVQILSAVYDGPMDKRSYSYQPVIFENIPTIDNGFAITETVTVSQGDRIVDSSGWTIVNLEIGTQYFPPGCYDSSCAVTYSGGQVEMEHLVITDTLMSGITWSDGHPLTSDDMLYSFTLMADPATPYGASNDMERTASYITTSLTQTMWTGLPGYFPYEYPAIYWMPLPEHIWSAYTPTELISATISSRTPLGWGAYVIDEWVSGDHISMHKNPNYFRAGEDLPRFENLMVHFGNVLSGVLNGTCDVVVNSYDDLNVLMAFDDEGLLEVTTTPASTWEHLDFAINPSELYTGFSAQTDAFEDVRVRQAFAYCIDRQAIADAVFHGMGVVPNAYILDEHPYYPPDGAIYPYDPAQGKALLEAAGWVDSNANGVRDRGGYEFSMILKTTPSQIRQMVSSMIAGYMAACGVQVTPQFPDSFWDDVSNRMFDAVEFTWLTGVQPPCYLYTSWNSQNDPGYNNPTYDQACMQAMGSLTEADRLENYRAVTRMFTQELPVLPLFSRLIWGITAPHITGFSLDPTESTFWNIEELGVGIGGSIPPEGGVLSSPADGTDYAFGAGSFPEPVVITHTALSPLVLPDFGGLAGAGHFFSLEGTLNGQPVEPSLPYTMTIGYTDDEHSYVYEDTLGLYYWNGENWAIEPTAVVDTLNNIIIATPGHFSYWAVLGEPYTTIYLPVIRR